LREKGYYNFTNNYISFTSDTNRNEKTASLTLYIKNFTRNEEPKNSKPHKLFKINKITIQPDYDPSEKLGTSPVEYDTIQYKKGMFVIYKDRLKIRPKFVEQINKIEPYSYYKLSDVTNTYNRFKDINLFTGTNIRFDEVPDNESAEIGLVDCSIKLTPSKTQGYTLNLELSSNSNNLFGISPAVSYFHKNLFNGGEWLNLSFMGNFQVNINSLVRSTELGVSTSLSIPNFLLIPETSFTTSIPRTEFKFLLNYQDRPEFTRSLVSAAYGYNWKSKHNLRFNFFPVQLSVVKLTNLSSSFYQSLENPFIRNSYRNYFDLGAGFNMATSVASVLVDTNFKAVSVANNHSFDYCYKGFLQTLTNLEQAGVVSVGGGLTEYEAYSPKYVMVKDDSLKIVMLGFSAFGKGYMEALDGTGGIAITNDVNKICSSVATAKLNSDLVIVSLHFGEEYKTLPGIVERDLAEAVVDCGADLIVGHHPHVVQPLEKYNDKYIAYSLGNFIFDQNFSPETMSGAILDVTVKDKKIIEAELIPTRMNSLFQPEVVKEN
jgi:hypothetical protein